MRPEEPFEHIPLRPVYQEELFGFEHAGAYLYTCVYIM
jgi:hypothetical protein